MISSDFFGFVFLDFLKRVLHFLFKDLYHLHKVLLKVIFLCFGCIGLFESCCHETAESWWCYIGLVAANYRFTLVFRHLGLGGLVLVLISEFVFVG